MHLCIVAEPGFFPPDILTPMPAIGVDFTIVPGKGPKIVNAVSCLKDVTSLNVLTDVETQVPFLGTILKVSAKCNAMVMK